MSVEYEFVDIIMKLNMFQISRKFAEGLTGGGGVRKNLQNSYTGWRSQKRRNTSHVVFVDVPLITDVEKMRKARGRRGNTWRVSVHIYIAIRST